MSRNQNVVSKFALTKSGLLTSHYRPAESFDYKFFSEGSEGLKVALVHHLDMPIVRQIGFHISPGTENQIAVTPTLISTSDDAMVRFSPDRRDCYSEGEIRDGGGSIAPSFIFIFHCSTFLGRPKQLWLGRPRTLSNGPHKVCIKSPWTVV